MQSTSFGAPPPAAVLATAKARNRPGPSRPPASVTSPPVTAVPDDPYEAIAKLAELHRSGALTDEEFTTAKARLLARD
jgi:Short C-terminal domain